MSGDLWVRCVQSSVEAMFHLETDELGCANAFVWALVVESSGHHMKL